MLLSRSYRPNKSYASGRSPRVRVKLYKVRSGTARRKGYRDSVDSVVMAIMSCSDKRIIIVL